jgi:hypothetical protein
LQFYLSSSRVVGRGVAPCQVAIQKVNTVMKAERIENALSFHLSPPENIGFGIVPKERVSRVKRIKRLEKLSSNTFFLVKEWILRRKINSIWKLIQFGNLEIG